MKPIKITWKAAGLVAFALVLTYLAHQVVRDAAKEIGLDAVLLGMLVTGAASQVPPLPEQPS
jgi:hypothetical protein